MDLISRLSALQQIKDNLETMERSFIKRKPVIAIIAIIIVASFTHIFFWRGDKQVLVSNIYDISFYDTVFNMYSLKHRGGVVVVTRLKRSDTPLIIDGLNDSLHLYFSSYSDLGFSAWKGQNVSILLKKARSDSFYLEKNNKTIGFKIVK